MANFATFTNKKPLGGINYQLIEMTDNRPGATEKKSSGDSHISLFALELDKAYMLIGQKEGFYPDTLQFNTVGLTDSKQYDKKLNLKPIPKIDPPVTTTDPNNGNNGGGSTEPEFETYTTNQPIELKNIFYDYNDDKILTESEPDLQIILDLMNQYPEMKIQLLSHTDARGKDAYNQDLSQRRASSAKRWLVQRGIQAPRIRAIGKGEAEIRNHCTNGVKCSDEEHRFNRRTEFRITEGPTTIQIETKRLKRRN